MDSWAELAQHISECGFAVHRDSEPRAAPQLPRRVPAPQELAWESDEFPEALPVDLDLLGLFTLGTSEWERGIHLFADRIMAVGVAQHIPPATLGLHTFWHEVTHCHLHCVAPRAGLAAGIEAFDIEEVACEVLACLALRHGRYTPMGLATHQASDELWKVMRWRRRNPVFPYSWFPRVMGVAELVGPAKFVDYVHRVRVAQAAGSTRLSPSVAEDAATLMGGQLSTRIAAQVIRDAPRFRPHRHEEEVSFPVFLWGAP